MNSDKRIEETARRIGLELIEASQRDIHFIASLDFEIKERTRLVREILERLKLMDPTSGKYLVWLSQQYANRQFRVEDDHRVRDVLENFIRFKTRMKRDGVNNNLTSLSFRQLERMLDDYLGVVIEDRFDVNVPDVKVLYDGPHGTLAIPLTKEASCSLGLGTKWCTAAVQKNFFYDYHTDETPLYIWKDRSGDKVQFWFGEDSVEIMNARDEPLDPKAFSLYRSEHPVLSKFLAEREKHVLQSPIATIAYIRDFLKARWPEAEQLLLADAEARLKYAEYGIRGPWLEAEDDILLNAEDASDYARKVLGKRWDRAERAILEDGNSDVCAIYAVYFKFRWAEAEDKIAKSANAAYVYARDVLKGRFPEAEPIIAQSIHARDYAEKVIGGRWPEAEPFIMQDPEQARVYAVRMLGDRWPEVENAIQRNDIEWNLYAHYFELAKTSPV